MAELGTEVLVIGAGPAGLAAAAAAAGRGAEVVVVDENPAPGGQVWREPRGAGARAPTRALLRRARGARLLTGASVFDTTAAGRVRAVTQDGEVLEIAAQQVVIATGASERFLPFPGWTLPGVFGVGGLQSLISGGLDARGRRIVIAGSGPLLLAVAASLVTAGARVVGIFEQAPERLVRRFARGLWRHPRKLIQAAGLLARLSGVPRRYDAWPIRAEGRGMVRRVVLSVGGAEQSIDTDWLACGFGLVPTTRLASLLGCEVRAGRVVVDQLQRTTVPGVLSAGESCGIGGVDVALREGTLAGLVAAAAARDRAAPGREPLVDPALARAAARVPADRRFASALETTFALREELRRLPTEDTLVCRCEDVAWGAIRACRGARQAKLEARCGMGSCQGRVCGPALEFLLGWPGDRSRPPLVPVPFAALASLEADDSASPYPEPHP